CRSPTPCGRLIHVCLSVYLSVSYHTCLSVCLSLSHHISLSVCHACSGVFWNISKGPMDVIMSVCVCVVWGYLHCFCVILPFYLSVGYLRSSQTIQSLLSLCMCVSVF